MTACTRAIPPPSRHSLSRIKTGLRGETSTPAARHKAASSVTMSNVDDELLALVGGGSSSSRASSPAAGSRRKRRRSTAADSMDDVEGSDDDSAADLGHVDNDDDDEGSGDDEERSANPFPLEGIYKDENDRDRLLDMPELEREDELARRRDIITRRRQKADLAAMVRSQQMAGQKAAPRGKPSGRKTRKLKQAAPAKKSRRKKAQHSDDDDGGGGDFADESDEDSDAAEEEEEDEGSDYGAATRRGPRANQRAQLHKLQKKRAKAAKRRGQSDSSEESSDESSGYDEGEMEELTMRKAARDRQMRGGRAVVKREDAKPSREEERLRRNGPKELPSMADVNAAKVRRDHFARLVHRPDWVEHLSGKFARISMNLSGKANAPREIGYRLVLIGDGYPGEQYYEVGEQYTNIVFTMLYGEEKFRNMPLFNVSNAPITADEHQRWTDRVESASEKTRRHIPSKELTQDRAEELEAFISRPFTEKDINDMIVSKKQARAAYEEYQSRRRQRHSQQQQQLQYAQHNTKQNGGHVSGVVDERVMAEMNERHRRADRERIAEAERRSQQLRRAGSQQLGSRPASQPNSQPVTAPASPRLKANGDGQVQAKIKPAPVPSSLSSAALDIDVDLGDF